MANETREKILLTLTFDQNEAKKNLANIKQNISDLTAENKRLQAAATDALKAQDPAQYQRITDQIIENEATLRNLAKQQRNYRQEIDLQIQANQAQAGSYEQLLRQQQLAQIQLKNLEGTLRRNEDGTIELTDEYVRQSKAVEEAKKAIISFDQGIKDGRSNVGNYQSSLEVLLARISDLGKARIDVSRGVESDPAKVKQATQDIITLGRESIKNATSVRELSATMKALQDAAVQATGEAKDQLIALAGEAQDQIGDIKAATKGLASDTANYDAFVQGGKLIASSFALAQGSAALFGEENENLQKSLVKIQGSIALLNGLTEIQNLLQAESTLRLKASAVAQGVYTAVVGTSTGALKAFRIALASTGIGLILLLVGALIANFDKVKAAIAGVIERLAFLAPFVKIFEVIGEKIRALGEFLGIIDDAETSRLKGAIDGYEKLQAKIQTRYDYEINLAKAAGKEVAALEIQKLKAQNEAIQKQLFNLFLLERRTGELTKDQKQMLEDLKKAYGDNLNQIRVTELEAERKSKEDREKANKERIDASKKAAEESRKLAEQLQDAQISLIENLKDREIEAEKVALERKLAEIKGSGEKEIQLRAALKEQSARRIAQIEEKSSQEERARVLKITQDRITNEQNDLRTSEERKLSLALELLQIQLAQELNQIGLSEQEKRNIRDKYRIEEERAQKEHYDRLREQMIQREADRLAAQIIQKQIAGESTLALDIQQAQLERDQALAEAGITNERKALIEAEFQQKLKQLKDQAIQDDMNRLKVQADIGKEIAGILGGVMNLFAEQTEANAQFQKSVAFFQIAIDTAMAISGATRAAQTQPYPLNILGVVTGIGTVLSNIAKAKQVLGNAPEPPKLAEGGESSRGQRQWMDQIAKWLGYDRARTAADGGPRTFPQLAIVGEKGSEWIAPNHFLRHPVTAPIIARLEEFRRTGIPAFAEGGYSTGLFSGQASGSAEVVDAVLTAVSNLPNPVVFVEDINTGQGRVSRIISRADI